jgi:NADPH2:quinone reductase
MSSTIPKTMRAAVIDRFGGPEVLRVASVPVPKPGGHEILIEVHTAGVGVWDPWLREGGSGLKRFPLVLGTDGAGTVVACGPAVGRFKPGDRVYGFAYESTKGGFFAEYAAIAEGHAATVPANIGLEEAGALAASGLTALAGLEALKVKDGWAVMILGASGGVGHVALQLAKRMKARLLAVASRTDGVDLVLRLGADRAVNGRLADPARAAERFAPDGLDAALAFANSSTLGKALALVKKGGAIAYPNGVEPEPKSRAGVRILAYDGLASPGAFERLNGLIARGPFHVEISRTYDLEKTNQALRDVLKHHVGKLALRVRG